MNRLIISAQLQLWLQQHTTSSCRQNWVYAPVSIPVSTKKSILCLWFLVSILFEPQTVYKLHAKFNWGGLHKKSTKLLATTKEMNNWIMDYGKK